MIPYGKHYIDDDDVKAVESVLRHGPLTQGPLVEKFETKISNYVGSKFAVAVSSGTAALHLANLVVNAKKQSSVLTTTISFIATANSAIYAGSKPKFVDIDPDTINMSSQQAIDEIEKDPSIAAVIPAHFAGLACEMEQIHSACVKRGIYLIEDGAHALGAEYKDGGRVGSCKHSDMTIFSLHPVKSIAAGEGGVITTNNQEIYRRLLRLRSHGINKMDDAFKLIDQATTGEQINPWYYEMQEIGYHYRITDIQSALAISQLKKITAFMKRRREIAKNYDAAFSEFFNCKPAQNFDKSLSSNHLYVIRIAFDKIKKSRAEVMNILKKKYEIVSQVHYMPIPMHPYYQEMGYGINEYPFSKKYYEECLSIPIYYSLTNEQQEYVIEAFRELVG